MQVFLSRREIRRQMRASLGQTTDEGLGGMNRDLLDTHIHAACLQAHAEMRPERAQRQETIELGIQQSLYQYHEDAGPGSLIEAAVYDAVGKVYLPLRRKRRAAINSDDKALATGGADLAAVTGMPKWISEEATGWRFFPTTDIAYSVRITYALRQVFNDDDEQSTVDGQLVLAWALHLETRVYDQAASERHLSDYKQRLALLKGWEQTGASISYDADADFDQDPDYGDEPPRWNTAPSRQG